MNAIRPLHILLELRPSLGGHAGIPQESRMLFGGLRALNEFVVEGFLQSSTRQLPQPRLNSIEAIATPDQFDLVSRLIIELSASRNDSFLQRSRRFFLNWYRPLLLGWKTYLRSEMVVLWRCNTAGFDDFFWKNLFSRSLEPEQRQTVASALIHVCADSWHNFHSAGGKRRIWGPSRYPILDLRCVDILVTHTPYPGRVPDGTVMIVRYYDAIPIFMPHTIADRRRHQSTHFKALRLNVESGAWFACPSEGVRKQITAIYPSIESRVTVIPCMIGAAFHDGYEVSCDAIEVISKRSKVHIAAGLQNSLIDNEISKPIYSSFSSGFLLVVATIEPRKNHLSVIAAWKAFRCSLDSDLALVFVGADGWDNEEVFTEIHDHFERKQLFVLNDVPPNELRALYRHARLTICPSYFEGFGLPAVEAMASGGIVLASDTEVHREVYGNGAVYFDPYNSKSLFEQLIALLGPKADPRFRDLLILNGIKRSSLYKSAEIIPLWRQLFNKVMHTV